MPRGDAIAGIATDPTSPRLALVLSQVVGTPKIDRAPRLVVVDTERGAITSHRELGRSLSAIEGEVRSTAEVT